MCWYKYRRDVMHPERAPRASGHGNHCTAFRSIHSNRVHTHPPIILTHAQASFKKPLHSYALIEVCRRFIKKAYRETYAMYHAGAGEWVSPHHTGRAHRETQGVRM